MSKHPESMFSDETWKGENGNGGLRNLYGLLAYLLAASHLQRHEDQRTAEQREIRKRAAEINFLNLYRIGAKIKSGEYVSPKEAEIWKKVEYDTNREALRGLLRAFDSVIKKNKFHPECLDDKQSHMTSLFEYIQDNQAELRNWPQFHSIQNILTKMGVNFE